jgi:hypothetical protein
MRLSRIVALLAVAGSTLVGAQVQAAPALFKVGVAVRNINPCATCPQYLGGFGYGPPVDGTGVHDALEVRVMAIANQAGDMVLFAIVDTQGYFAGNQEGPWGNRDARLAAAAQIKTLGYDVTEANIIVSSTHSHAAPTIMGIWGTTDVEYLKQVYAATVDALVDAASNLRAANLYAGKGDIATVSISGVTQTDGYQGWRAEGDLPVLWARDPVTDETLGLYANVPTHADIVNGVDDHIISADHIGVERSLLDADLGGTSVVAMGTLGRQETIVQVDGFDEAANVGRFVANEVERALANATAITDDTVAAVEQYMLIPATNPALAALNTANVAGDAADDVTGDPIGTHCIPGVDICTIDRAILPPYAAGAAFGTWFTAFRIGGVVYATEPGEAFPEVSTGIRKAMGAPDVRIVGMAQDQLGYYYPPETFPWTAFNDSDHHFYNASLFLGEANVQAHALNAALLGFTPAAVHETSQFDDIGAAVRAGVQFFPIPREQADPTFRFDVRTSESVFGERTMGLIGPANGPPNISWAFGDDGTAVSGQGAVSHTYAAPGMYTVIATVTGSDGAISKWTQRVTVDPPLGASVSINGDALTASSTGGQGSLLAAHWTFSNGSTADGLRVTRPTGTTGAVTVVDGAGNRASASFA